MCYGYWYLFICDILFRCKWEEAAKIYDWLNGERKPKFYEAEIAKNLLKLAYFFFTSKWVEVNTKM